MRYAIVEKGVVTNVVMWDGDLAKWKPPQGSIAVASDKANIGDTWDGATTFTPGAVKVDPPAPLELAKAEYAAALTTDAKVTALAKAVGVIK